MKSKKDDLIKIVQDLTVKLYQQAHQENQANGGQPTGDQGDGKKDDDNTVDGDFEEVNPDDKK